MSPQWGPPRPQSITVNRPIFIYFSCGAIFCSPRKKFQGHQIWSFVLPFGRSWSFNRMICHEKQNTLPDQDWAQSCIQWAGVIALAPFWSAFDKHHAGICCHMKHKQLCCAATSINSMMYAMSTDWNVLRDEYITYTSKLCRNYSQYIMNSHVWVVVHVMGGEQGSKLVSSIKFCSYRSWIWNLVPIWCQVSDDYKYCVKSLKTYWCLSPGGRQGSKWVSSIKSCFSCSLSCSH